MKLHFSIPITPMSTNRANKVVTYPVKGQPGKFRSGIRKTAEAEQWMRRAVEELQVQRMNAHLSTLECPVALWIDVYREANQGDIDNYAKGVLDALQGAAILRNDTQVMELHMRKLVDKSRPRYELAIERLGTQPLFPLEQQPQQR